MGGVGGPEVLVILIVALLVFGPKSIPDVARTIGKGVRELRRLATEFQREVNIATAEDDEQRRIAPAVRRVAPEATDPAPGAPSTSEVPRPSVSAEPERRAGDEAGPS